MEAARLAAGAEVAVGGRLHGRHARVVRIEVGVVHRPGGEGGGWTRPGRGWGPGPGADRDGSSSARRRGPKAGSERLLVRPPRRGCYPHGCDASAARLGPRAF